MKKLLLPLVLFTIFTKAQTQQDYYNQSPSGIDPVISMTSNGESENVKMANEAIKKGQERYKSLNEKLQKSQERVENLEVAKFEDVYQPATASENRNYNQSGNGQPTTQNGDVDPFGSTQDEPSPFQGEKINVDDYYTQQKDGSYIKKDIGNQKPSNNGGDNTILIVVILIVGAGIIGALVTNQGKSKNGHNNVE